MKGRVRNVRNCVSESRHLYQDKLLRLCMFLCVTLSGYRCISNYIVVS